jgi:acetyl esterase
MNASAETLHPQCVELLSRLPPRAGGFTVEGSRSGHAALATWVCGPSPSIGQVVDLSVPAGAHSKLRSPEGRVFGAQDFPAVALRRYVPRQGADRAIVYLHGGGWVQGTLDTYDTLCREIALVCDAQVFSVAYRLSPETRYPGALLDSARALLHVRDIAAQCGLDPARTVVAGDSAGGHLAISASRWLKAQGLALPAAMALIYPVADRRLASDSARAFAEGHYLTHAQMEWFWQQFLGDQTVHAEHPDLSPALATDLAGLPPSLVITAGCDILRDEGEALARQMVGQGVPAETLRMPGMLHGFIRFGAVIEDAHRAVAAISDSMRRWFP